MHLLLKRVEADDILENQVMSERAVFTRIWTLIYLQVGEKSCLPQIFLIEII